MLNSVPALSLKTRGLTAAQLRWLALFFMTLDHLAYGLLRQLPAWGDFEPDRLLLQAWAFGDLGKAPLALALAYWLLRAIGRLAFPLFAFLLSEGLAHSHDRARYALRVLVFAVLSDWPYALLAREAYHFGANVLWTLALALLFVSLAEYIAQHWLWQEPLRSLLLPLGVFVAAFIAEVLASDYGAMGVLTVGVLYMSRQQRKWQIVLLLVVMLSQVSSAFWQGAGALSALLIYAYNGRAGCRLFELWPSLRLRKGQAASDPRKSWLVGGSRYAAYVYYPLHQLLLAGLALLLCP